MTYFCGQIFDICRRSASGDLLSCPSNLGCYEESTGSPMWGSFILRYWHI